MLSSVFPHAKTPPSLNALPSSQYDSQSETTNTVVLLYIELMCPLAFGIRKRLKARLLTY